MPVDYKDGLVRSDTFTLGWWDRLMCLLTIVFGGKITVRTDTSTEFAIGATLPKPATIHFSNFYTKWRLRKHPAMSSPGTTPADEFEYQLRRVGLIDEKDPSSWFDER